MNNNSSPQSESAVKWPVRYVSGFCTIYDSENKPLISMSGVEIFVLNCETREEAIKKHDAFAEWVVATLNAQAKREGKM